MRTRVRVAAVAAALVLAVAAGLNRAEAPVRACGPFVDFPLFVSPAEPDSPQFYRGNLGILGAGFRPRYMVVAWRTLAGRPLTDAERAAPSLVPAPGDAAAARPPQPLPVPPVDAWLQARRALGFGEVPYYLNREGYVEATFSFYLNCTDSAFSTAAATLEDRKKALGAESPAFRAWVLAQDQVFSNCDSRSTAGPRIPEPLGADASPAARADRAYQMAAALFYAGQLAGAERAFTGISRDPASPWRRLAPYLAARAIVRQATIGAKDAPVGPAAFERARKALQAILDDPGQSSIHEPATKLLRYVHVREHPADALAVTARALVNPDTDAARFDQNLTDFSRLLDRAASDTSGYRSSPPDPAADDLTDWVRSWRGAAAGAHARDRWHATHADYWLAAALAAATPGDGHAAELLEAAGGVSSQSPVYPTVAFHSARLLLLSGSVDAARSVLDTALSTPRLTRGAVNQFRAARIQTARSLEEFLRDAARTPIGVEIDGDVTPVVFDKAAQASAYDRDAIDVINERMPLAMMRRAATSPLVPRPFRRPFAAAVFTRAVLLGDPATVRAVLPGTGRAIPALATALAPLARAPDDRALMDEAWLLLLDHPGLRPFVPIGGFRRPDDLTRIDSLRDNWWGTFAPSPVELTPYMTQYWGRGGRERLSADQQSLYASPTDLPALRFLSADETSALTSETTRLQSLRVAPTELQQHAIEWATAHRDDPRAPRVLAKAVRAGHFGCGDETTWPLSKRAFTLLHQRYPSSVWARKTPYWYK